MDPSTLRQLLEEIARGELEVDAAVERLRDLPFADLGFANVDHHRPLRSGTPEVVLGAGKTFDQILAIVREIDAHGEPVLVTRLDEERGAELARAMPELRYDPISRTAVLSRKPIEIRGRGPICVVTGGTSDIPVAEEAAVTAEFLGNAIIRLFDVGVAGVHRLLARREVLEGASVVIVVAGMEGALPSVVGGLIDRPIIAVPTSVGYGASFGGIAALLGMLNSCAAGVTVVNIDNGFGAACAASLINRAGVD
jgi:NCAIR mutase (PurE)-related protein